MFLKFGDNLSIELTSSNARIQEWGEFGNINVEVLSSVMIESTNDWVDLELSEALDVTFVEIVRWQSAGLLVDAGIRLHFSGGRILSVVAVDVLGALFSTLPGGVAPCSWQFPVNECVFVSIEEAG